MKVNFNGHFGKKRSQAWYTKLLEDAVRTWKIFSDLDEDIDLPEALRKECRELRIPYDLKTCPECGEKITWKQTKDSFRATKKCKYPGGYPEIVFVVPFPSGKMVIGNDFRDLYPIKESDNHDINKTIGIVGVIKDYERVGLAHAFVGNSCPGVFKINKETFVIGVAGKNNKHPVSKSKRVAGVCTDLWWYSIADYDDFVKRGGDPKQQWIDVIDCEVGAYQFSHRYHLLDRDKYDLAQVFTSIKRLH